MVFDEYVDGVLDVDILDRLTLLVSLYIDMVWLFEHKLVFE